MCCPPLKVAEVYDSVIRQHFLAVPMKQEELTPPLRSLVRPGVFTKGKKMDWQQMIVFSVVFWATYHLSNVVKDYQRAKDLTRLLRDMDKLGAKIDKKYAANGDDTLKRIK